ncbi:ABC transporter permease [Paenibacillus sp. M1]|uniref:ABC transporter permease n=1 Tax=Paenibacillus haidiansis TaxID=1574488 RepID=A0ABU7VN79_9BACL
MKTMLKWVWRDILRNRLQSLLIVMLITATAFIYLFIRYASDGIAEDYNKFIATQRQEEFAFTLNLASSLDQEQQWVLLSRSGISRQKFDMLGFNNVREKYRLNFASMEIREAERLSRQYHFEYEQKVYKTERVNGITIEWGPSHGPRKIDLIYITDGRLPEKQGEIVLPRNGEAVLPSAIGRTIELNNRTYTVVGTFIEPQRLKQVSTDPAQHLSIYMWPADYDRLSLTEQTLYAARFPNAETASERDEALARMREDASFAAINPADQNPDASELIQGIASNQGMSYTFLFVLALLCGGIYYVFLDRRLNAVRQSWGTLTAMGYSPGQVITAFLAAHSTVCLAGVALGWAAAYNAASLLIGQFQMQYVLPSFPRRASVTSVLIGVAFIFVAFLLPLYMKLRMFARQSPLTMLRPAMSSSPKRMARRLAAWTAGWPFPTRIKWRMALRSSRVIILLGVTVMLSSMMFMLGFSLHRSSLDSVNSEIAGIGYNYDLRYNEADIEQGEGAGGYYYRLEGKYFAWEDNKSGKQGFQGNLLAWDGGDAWLNLLSRGGQSVNDALEQGAVVHYSKAKLLGLQVGMVLTVRADNVEMNIPIRAFAYNGDPDTVYMKKAKLAENLGLSPNIYNGRFSLESDPGGSGMRPAETISVRAAYQERLSQASSSQFSAVLNQVLGGIIAIIMMMLISVIITEENRQNMAVLQWMGYEPAEIRDMLINVYAPVLFAAYMITLPLSAAGVSYILRVVSVNTNDYIPFIFNGWILIGVLALILLVYYGVIFLSSQKIIKKTAGIHPQE